jgi:hypothetical protein
VISPHTPPGTRVVCIDAEIHTRNVIPGCALWDTYVELVEGEVYIVDSIEPQPLAKSGFCVNLRGCNSLWTLERFKVAALPECLTEILTKSPVDLERV